ncbi:MAG: carboxypeptidase-like regulatory domain-containing protein [Gemmataceae bacterium]|nr:carboxypeptidase-like regulatory domain-containing protein [Gemmataceae bacterium]
MQRVLVMVGTVVLAVGCGGSGDSSAVPVNGIVTLDGAPLDGATVVFIPEDKAAREGTTGGHAKTGTDGKFVILGTKGQSGLAPGQYKVTVSKTKFYEEPPVGAIVEGELKDDLPPHYSNSARTKLSYTVTGDGKPIEIKLTKK